jgi:hypothetical protein
VRLKVLRITTRGIKITCSTSDLEKLFIQKCRIKYLPYMPVIKNIQAESNKIRKLPKLPETVRCIDISFNKIKVIKFFPKNDNRTTSFCGNNKIKDYSYLNGGRGKNLFLVNFINF